MSFYRYYKEVYNNGLVCQKNWADLSSLVAQEYVDCWLISVNYYAFLPSCAYVTTLDS